MAFTQATAPTGLRAGELLSADNSIPERHIVIATLRNAAPRLGLSASVITTLDAMLSCLAPKRNHHTVFASNATLMFRRNGISDRTIRRHAAALQEIGLLVRRDSPNRKRFTKHNTLGGKVLRFGFDLSPLFERLPEIAAIAAEVLKEHEQIDYLRTKIRAAANESLAKHPHDQTANNLFRVLRRKLSLQDCQGILKDLPITELQAEASSDQNLDLTTPMTAKDGHSVRHHHKSNKEHIDKENIRQKEQPNPEPPDAPVTVPELLSACPEAAQFSLREIKTVHDVIAHARVLAPMLGISHQCYEAAHVRLGGLRAAATVWAIVQFHDKIKTVGAYFRSITTGSKSIDFSPEKLVRRLAKKQDCSA
ncbi:MAG: plasmid replication protein RepC [Sulfitobacter sp.]